MSITSILAAMSKGPNFSRTLVVSGPSGVGKSTLLDKLFKEFNKDPPRKSPGDYFRFSVSHTTRRPRTEPPEKAEIPGQHYHFLGSKDDFKSMIDRGEFIEYAEFSGNFYGTSFETLKSSANDTRRCILDIEAQGVRKIKASNKLDPVYLFICPPSLAALSSRLDKRGTDKGDALRMRLETAISEIEYAMNPSEKAHDFIIVNDDPDEAYAKFKRVALGYETAEDDAEIDDRNSATAQGVFKEVEETLKNRT
ncbi:guanylate kinase [Mycena maculata]|uniref:guanylate kinase n=1 Tax=Mycena maculata TaxID=230809 RepID=A0AAD7JM51_9AGAR|nr:guanylate kinase [Mycena maculata]